MGMYFSKDYFDFESYREDVERWNLDHRKLNVGKFYGFNALIDIGNVQIVRTKIGGVFDQNGLTPQGFRTFVFPANMEQSYYWLNRKLDSKCIAVFPLNGVIDGITYENLDIYVISVKEQHLHHLIDYYKFLNLDKSLGTSEITFPINQAFVYYLNSYLDIIYGKLQYSPDIINSPSFVNSLKYKLPFKILSFLDKKEIVPIPIQSRKRDKAINKCISYILTNINRQISLRKLTEIANVSERTLEYAFLERFGVTPKNYIAVTKLNKIKTELINPFNKELVSSIARKYAFNHMGQFSKDFKNLFGESPSATLLNSK